MFALAVINFILKSVLRERRVISLLEHFQKFKMDTLTIESSNALERDKKKHKPLPAWKFPNPDKAPVILSVLDLRSTAFATAKVTVSLTDVFQRVGLTPRGCDGDGKNL